MTGPAHCMNRGHNSPSSNDSIVPETAPTANRIAVPLSQRRVSSRSIGSRERSQRHSLASFLTENYISQMTVFWRRNVHDQIGFLDPEIRYAFDYDLFLRLAQRCEPLYIEEPLACFRWYVTSKSGGGFVVQMTETVEIASRSRAANNWTRTLALAKRSAIINIYRALGVARTTFNRF